MQSARLNALIQLEAQIHYTFQNKDLLNMALTHTSYVKGDGKGILHNERLEFLGDAVLELLVSDYLYEQYTQLDEGHLTRLRALTVCESALYQAAIQRHIQEYLLLGHGEEATGGRRKPSIVSDAMEALIGAIYLDGGMEAARTFVLDFAITTVKGAAENLNTKDYKTMLQEYIQKRHMGSIRYQLVSATGPDHKKVFHMHVILNDQTIGTGTGHSKQEAGQCAAKEALECILQPSD